MSAAEAVPPQGSPVPTMSDLAYANMYAWQEALVRPFATTTGLAPGTVLFTLALFASLPLGAGFHLLPGRRLKNLYGICAGTRAAPERSRNRRTHRDPGIDITPLSSRRDAGSLARAPSPSNGRTLITQIVAERRRRVKKPF